MKWDPLQKEADKRGWLVFAMSQEQTIVTRFPGPWGEARNGYCLGAAVHWISCCYQGRKFPFVVNRICRFPSWQAIRAHNIHVKDGGFSSERAALKQYQLTINAGKSKSIFFQKPYAKFIFSIALHGYGCCLILLTHRSTGNRDESYSHAIATWHSRDKNFHLFDANYGHFRVPRLQSMNFLDFFLNESPYSVFDTYTHVRCINPPMGVQPR